MSAYPKEGIKYGSPRSSFSQMKSLLSNVDQESEIDSKYHILQLENERIKFELAERNNRVEELELHLHELLQSNEHNRNNNDNHDNENNNSSLNNEDILHELIEKEIIIEDLTHELERSQEQSNDYKRQVDEFRLKCDEIQKQLFESRDDVIALNSKLANYEETQASSAVLTEYDLLHEIIGDLNLRSPRSHESSQHVDDVHLLQDTQEQLEIEKGKNKQMYEQLQLYDEQILESTSIIINREKEISMLISSQQTFLQDQSYLRSDLIEVRQQKTQLQAQLLDLEEKNKYLRVEILELKNKIHRAQVENLRTAASSPSNKSRRSSTAFSEVELPEPEEFKDSFDYSTVPLDCFNENIVQKLLLDYTMVKLKLKETQIDQAKLKASCVKLETLSCDLKFKLANALVDLDEEDTWNNNKLVIKSDGTPQDLTGSPKQEFITLKRKPSFIMTLLGSKGKV